MSFRPTYQFDHVHVYCSDLAASEDWFVSKLGAELVNPTAQTWTEYYGRLARAAHAGTIRLSDRAGAGLLRQEIAELEADTTRPLVRIDHPPSGSKDLADALVYAMGAADRELYIWL